MFSLEKAEFRYDPYPIGIVRPVMEPEFYDTLVESFPPVELFKYMAKFGHKYTLSEKFNPEHYHKYIAEHRPWRELHAWIKSEAFFRMVDALLRAHNIDLGLETARFAGQGKWPWRLSELAKGRWPRGDAALRTRFEFSMLPAAGGNVPPHTDTPEVGLNRILITEEKDSRTFSIRALPGAKPLEQLIYVSGIVETRSSQPTAFTAEPIVLKIVVKSSAGAGGE